MLRARPRPAPPFTWFKVLAMRSAITRRLVLVLVGLLAVGAVTDALARPWWLRGVETNETDFLPPDVAFRVSASAQGSRIQVRWVIAPGYYLYRHRMSVAPESPDLLVAGLLLPRGVVKVDPYLGRQEIFTQQVDGLVPFRRLDYGAHPLAIRVTYQGCAEAGLCYPPIMKVLNPESGTLQDAAPLGSPGWEGIAIGCGVVAFLLAGLILRGGRRLEPPPP